MVSCQGARTGCRYLRQRFFPGRDPGTARGRMADSSLRMADSLCGHRRPRVLLAAALAVDLSKPGREFGDYTEKASPDSGGSAEEQRRAFGAEHALGKPPGAFRGVGFDLGPLFD